MKKPKPRLVPTTFSYANASATAVNLAGSFNGWDPSAHPLIAQGDGIWLIELSLRPGRHEYLFVVDGVWLPDPSAAEWIPNPHGGVNSVVTVS